MFHRVVIVFVFIFLKTVAAAFGFSQRPSHSEDMSYYTENNGERSIQEVLSANDIVWKTIDEKILNLGYNHKPFWLKIPLKNNNGDEIFVLENSNLDSLYFYQVKDTIIIVKSLQGDMVEFNNRDFPYRYPNFEIESGVTDIYIRISGDGSYQIPISIRSQRAFYKHSLTFQFLYFIYLGILILAIVVYLFLIRSLRNKIHLYYVLSIFSLGIVVSFNNGYLFEFIYPHHPHINSYAPSIYALMSFVLLFSEHFLKIKTRLPKIKPVYTLLYGLHFLVVAGNILGYFVWSIKLVAYIWIVSPVFLLGVTSYVYYKTRAGEIKYLLFAWSIFLSFILLFVLSFRDFVPVVKIQDHLLLIGAALEVIFMFLAIVNEFEKVNNAHKLLLQEQNKILDEKLKNRTAEIVQKNESLQAQYQELSQLKKQSDEQKDILLKQNQIIEEQNKILNNKKIALEELINQKTENLVLATKALEERNNRFDQFTFIAAHKLRGPVATLKGILNLSKSEWYTQNRTQLATEAEVTLEKLDDIIKELIFVLDLPTNTKELKETTHIEKIISNIADSYTAELEQIKGTIEIKCKNLPPIHSIPIYIENIFKGLISNSIRFRNEQRLLEITISCSFDTGGISIVVSDNGQGMNLSQVKDKIFSPFQRFHQNSGKGLGLFVLKSQLDALDASIEVAENQEYGLNFTINLPYN